MAATPSPQGRTASAQPILTPNGHSVATVDSVKAASANPVYRFLLDFSFVFVHPGGSTLLSFRQDSLHTPDPALLAALLAASAPMVLA